MFYSPSSADKDGRKYNETFDGPGQALNTTIFHLVARTDSHFQLDDVPQFDLAPAPSPSFKPLLALNMSSNPRVRIDDNRNQHRPEPSLLH